jgi:hypothetical protein
MTEHPENEEWMNELIRSVESQELVDVWCLGCKDWRKMNSQYSKYVKGEINNCGKCRG